MGSMQWIYFIDACVEDTNQKAAEYGFSTIIPEGRSKNGNSYLLNQVELWGGDFDSRIKIIVGPNVTQIYFSINDIPSTDQLETVVDNLDKVESILNKIVVFNADETVRYSRKTRKPVMNTSMLKASKLLHDGFTDVLFKVWELAIKEHSKELFSLAQGKKLASSGSLNEILDMLIKLQREAIRMAREQGNENADRYECELDKLLMYSNLFDVEVALAKSPSDIRKIIDKYSSKLFNFS